MRCTQHAIVRCEDSPSTHSKNKDTTNKLLEQMLQMHSKDARPMSVPTTRATTHANDKQHGTLKHIKHYNVIMSNTRRKRNTDSQN